jgi:hypothetical protein
LSNLIKGSLQNTGPMPDATTMQRSKTSPSPTVVGAAQVTGEGEAFQQSALIAVKKQPIVRGHVLDSAIASQSVQPENDPKREVELESPSDQVPCPF